VLCGHLADLLTPQPSAWHAQEGKTMNVPKSVLIVGRRWFQKTYGNTYNTATIYVDGKFVHKTAKQYGYGEHFLTIAADWLEQNGYMPEREHHANGSAEPIWAYFRDRHGAAYHYETIDVTREKDL
jgi:hypothetical protein